MASLLPNAKQQFCDQSGTPLALGSVSMFTVGTTTPKTTWQDSAGTIANTNPIILDAAGEAIIYGTGQYRQIVQAANGTTVWDQITAAPDFQSEFSVSGDVTIGGTLTVGGLTTINDDVTITGALTVPAAGSFAVNLGGQSSVNSPGGVIRKFGSTVVTVASNVATINFTVPFPNACLCCVVSNGDGSASLSSVGLANPANFVGFTIQTPGLAAGAYRVNWIAEGN